MSAGREPIIPEPVVLDEPGYAEGHWDYPRRCANVESALTDARERVEEWDRDADAHGWWHERPHWIALHNEVLRLRQFEPAEPGGLCLAFGGVMPDGQVRVCGRPRWHGDSHAYEFGLAEGLENRITDLENQVHYLTP